MSLIRVVNSIAILILFTHALHAEQFSTVFCHGLNAGPTQAAKLKPEHISSITGEKISCTKGIDVLLGDITVPAMSEIVILPKKRSWSPLERYYRLIANKIARKHSHEYGITVHANDHELTLNGHGKDLSKTVLGQEADIEKLQKAFDEHRERYPNDSYILYGCSRGAAATFTMVCLNKGKESLKKVKAVVLEGCFDSVPNLLQQRYGYAHPLAHLFITKKMSYKKDGLSPLAVVHNWPAEIPVLFVTSKSDKEVPIERTQALVCRLKQQVPQAQVHMVVLEHSSHPRYAIEYEADKRRYEAGVHAFYQKYHIAHDAEKAHLGAQVLQEVS